MACIYFRHRSLRIYVNQTATVGLKLIDFDWCGMERTARYPADINLDPDIEWHGEVRHEGLITKAHDIHILNLLVGSP